MSPERIDSRAHDQAEHAKRLAFSQGLIMDGTLAILSQTLSLSRTRRALRLVRLWNSLLPCVTSGQGRRSRSRSSSRCTVLSSNGFPKASRFCSISRPQTSTLATGARSFLHQQLQAVGADAQQVARPFDASDRAGECVGGASLSQSQKAR